MLSSLKLGQQLSVSFITILALMLVVSVVGYVGLSKGVDNFTEYRELAKNSNITGTLNAELLQTRLAVVEFLQKQENQQVEIAMAGLNSIDKQMSYLLTTEADPNRIKEIKESQSFIATYKEKFNEIVKDFNISNQIINDQLEPSGEAMSQAMIELIALASNSQDIDALSNAANVQQKLLLARLYTTKFIRSDDDQDLERAQQELEALMTPLSAILASLNSNAARQLTDEFRTAHSTFVTTLNKTADLIHHRNKTIVNGLDNVGPLVTTNLNDYDASINQARNDLGKEVQANSEMTITTVIIVSVIAVVVGGLLSMYVTRLVRRPIGGEPIEIERIARKIAAGDLTQQFANAGQATGIYGAMIEVNTSLQQIVGQLTNSSSTLSKSSKSLVTVTDETVHNSEAQAQQLEQTAAAMQEMTHTVLDIARNAQQASDAATEADTFSHQGKSVLEETRTSITSLVSNIGDVSSIIENLEKETENVGSILDVIRGIAEQTNLLALNAAIEAARAGEQGRGFAVVADEVRSLASRTQQSTEEIQSLISRLQSESKRSVDSMKLNVLEATKTSEKANQTHESLVAITQSVSNIRDMNHQIAVAAEEQNTVVVTINNSVDEISTLANNTSNGASSVSKQASDLASISNELNHIVGKFKVS
ncbi:methyl-accepting chemotaxis protein [Shewanella sp. NIFS-20-20]|uniref:HAMP domain-containing methyl-accepting chemotaxis protein n=1 Tax=Shewanella sp. NIFS-20-20 TaxID=2853806 RepID=UPI001C48D2B9|nr:methyl-accepting chemotaxis protein [Shewanella sp. NIFS-20-20]MBV7317274.1 methyl-accepting chemotaxis protein [Shewanella sp. NIFS-20-20]